MKKADRWTVKQARKPRRDGKRWWVYPPGHMIDRSVGANRRFDTWEQAIDYVFDEGIRMKRQRSMRTRLRASNPSFGQYSDPAVLGRLLQQIFGDDNDRLVYRWDQAGREVEPWHGKATGQAS